MRNVPPEEAVFMVPLRDDGFAVGVLARASGEGHSFGYFFGPRIQSEDDIDVKDLAPQNAVLVGKFGDLELLRGNWKVVSHIPDWHENRWEMKPLARVDEKTGRAWLSTYDDLFNLIKEEEISVEGARN